MQKIRPKIHWTDFYCSYSMALSRLRLALRKAVAAKILPLVERIVVALDRYAEVALVVEHSHQYIPPLVAVEDELQIDRHTGDAAVAPHLGQTLNIGK